MSAFALFGLLMFGLWIAVFAYWVYAIVDVVRIPDHQFRAAGTDKTVWVLVVVLGSIVGALVWAFAKRNEVRAAAGRIPPPPPGWYADPSGGMRWWDGAQWTYAHHVPPPPPPAAR